MPPIDEQIEKALSHHQRGELSKALEIYKKILMSEPDHSNALHLSGVVEHQFGRHGAAIKLIRRAIAVDPKNSNFHVNLGNALQDQNQLDESVSCYHEALRLKPQSPEAYYNLGNALQRWGKIDEAVDSYEKALALNPDFPEALTNMGNALTCRGDLERAFSCFRKVVDLKPGDAEAINNLGTAYKELKDWKNAADCYRESIHIKPQQADFYYNMGNLLHDYGELEKAVFYYQEAIQRNASHLNAHDNLGKTFRDMGLLDVAMDCYTKSLSLNPNNPETKFDVATLQLLQGNLREGFKAYETRFERDNWKSVYPFQFQIPRWDGSPFPGKRLFVHSEQGFGDSLQFVRYLPMVKAMGGEVVFEIVRPLMALFQHLKGIDLLLEGPKNTKQDLNCDFYVPLLSLPGIFKTHLDTIPRKVPYLFADSDKVGFWKGRLPKENGLRVGLVWAGKQTDARRSCPLKDLEPLLSLPRLQVIGLQKGPSAREISLLPEQTSFSNLGESFEDFSDTAAVIDQLDLVISVDTAVAHLAGAMGKPVWVLLLKSPDWRWLMDRPDSPWYPTMRLFRQSKPGDWSEPVKQMVHALSEILHHPQRLPNTMGSKP